ncbi:MAG TPA: hypothetical protein VFZ96_07630 [Actinomycetota bacterium]|nr:hypothetical protein [Actinomycetota bacterium]
MRGARGALPALAAVALVLGSAACTSGSEPASGASRSVAAPSPSPPPTPSPEGDEVRTAVGGVSTVRREVVLPPELLPYPYTTPTPAPERTELDGTYIRIVTFEDAGGFRYAIPRRCLRCIPYKLDPGVHTLVIHEGAFYVNHQLSGFTDLGHVQVEPERATLFNDPICPQARGVYRWALDGKELTLSLVEDPCFPGRAEDLTFSPWIRVNPCVYRIDDLWPAALDCV